MSTHPFIPLYVDDFEAATAHLSPEEDGIYNRLLRLCWRTPGCNLPDDPAWIARKIRLTEAEFERLAKPLIDEFFTRQRGRLIQRRLKREYDSISCKRLARKQAGKKGGEAKARKTHDNPASNATVLPGDTRAFPEPYPDKKESPLPPKGEQADLLDEDPAPDPEKLSPIEKAELAAAWTEAHPGSRKRSSKGQVARAAIAARNRGKRITDIRRALAAYAAERSRLPPAEAERYAKGLHLLIQGDRWEEWVTAQAAPPKRITQADRDRAEWEGRMIRWKRDRTNWDRCWGPEPGEPGCDVPPDVMAQFGIAPAEVGAAIIPFEPRTAAVDRPATGYSENFHGRQGASQ